MIVSLTRPNAPTLLDERNFRALKVEARNGSSADDIASSLGDLGKLEGDHVWLSIDGLKSIGPNENAWKQSFDEMISYANKAGWVSEDKSLVRAHVDLTVN